MNCIFHKFNYFRYVDNLDKNYVDSDLSIRLVGLVRMKSSVILDGFVYGYPFKLVSRLDRGSILIHGFVGIDGISHSIRGLRINVCHFRLGLLEYFRSCYELLCRHVSLATLMDSDLYYLTINKRVNIYSLSV